MCLPLCIVDVYTSYLDITTLKTKSSDEGLQAFEPFLKPIYHLWMPSLYLGILIMVVNFIRNNVNELCIEFAVILSLSVPNSPPQHSQAEECEASYYNVCALPSIKPVSLNKSFWTFADEHAWYWHNISPSARFSGANIPMHINLCSVPNFQHINVWGRLYWFYLPPYECQSIVSPHAVRAVHLDED